MKCKYLVVGTLVAFFCAVVPAGATSWKFVVMADSQGYGTDNTNTVSTVLLGDMATYVANTVQPDVVVFDGDLTDAAASQASVESALNTWKTTMAPIYNASIPVYPVRGSHDLGGNTKQTYSDVAWQNVFTLPTNGPAAEQELTYSFTHNNATFLVLDEYRLNPGTWATVDTSWVATQLASNTNPHIFTFEHSQMVKVEHDYCLDQCDVTARNALFNSLTAANAKVHFTGHMHLSNVTRLNNDTTDPTDTNPIDDYYQVIVAPCSQKFYDWNPEVYDGNAIAGWTPHKDYNQEYQNGFTVVEVDGLDVTVTYMRKYGAGDYRAEYSFDYTAVPEPATMLLLAAAGLPVLLKRRRRS